MSEADNLEEIANTLDEQADFLELQLFAGDRGAELRELSRRIRAEATSMRNRAVHGTVAGQLGGSISRAGPRREPEPYRDPTLWPKKRKAA